MNRKCKIQAAVILALVYAIGVFAEVVVPTVISVDENHPIKPVDMRLLGFNHEWAGQYPVCDIPNAAGYNTNVVTALSGLSIPVNRMSGTVSQKINWKGAIGPYANRTTQQLTSWYNKKIGCGPVEWLQMIKAIDPASGVTWTVNMYETPENAADLVEFLTGDGLTNPNGGTNWAQVRISYGITNPVIVDVWELGNELDGTEFREDFQNSTNYTDLCKPFIAAIRSVRPDAKIAAHAMTHSSYNDYQAFFGVPWTEWHRNVLREIGNDIDYIAFHTYYNSLPSSSMESHVNQIAADISSAVYTTNTQIKMYLSEYSWWPKTNDCPVGTTTEWKDSWYTTHALMGCLGTADWMTRMMNSPVVEMAAYHAFCGGGWSLLYTNTITANKLHTTGITDLYALFGDAFSDGVSIVPVEVSGVNTARTNSSCLFTVAALTTSDGVNLILANRDTNTIRSIDLSFRRQYTLIEKTVFTAPSMLAYNTATNRPITITRTTFPSGESLCGITVPAKSMVVLKVRAAAVPAELNAYTPPHVISSNTSSGTAINTNVVLTGGTFTVWGSTGSAGSYSLKILMDSYGKYLSLNSTRTSGNPVAQVSTTAAMPLSDNWAVKTRFSAIAGSGSLYFGLYATNAMTSTGGYDYTRLIIANTNTSAVALGFSISQTGNAVVTRTAANNRLEFWNGSAWVASGSGAYAATGLDVTGGTQYDLMLSTDGTDMNISLMNAATFESIVNVDSSISELGSNITAANMVRFSAGDVANNSTDGWTANIYALSVQGAPAVSADLNAYPPAYTISANTSSGTAINDDAVLLDSSASETFTVWGSTGLTGSYSLKILSDGLHNYLNLSSTRTNGNPLAQVSTTVARPLADKWAVKAQFSMTKRTGVSGYAYFGLYGGSAMSVTGGYELKQISSPNTNTAVVALQLSVNSAGDAYITRTGPANILQYWTGSAWSTSSTAALSGLDVTGGTRYSLTLSTDGITMMISLMDEAVAEPLIHLSSSVSDLGSNVTAANAIRFSAGDIGSNTAYNWDTGIHALSIHKTPVVSAGLNAYAASHVIMSNTTTGTALTNRAVLLDSATAGTFTVWGSGTGTGSRYSAKVLGNNSNNYLTLNSTKGTSAYNLLSHVSTTEGRSLSGNWAVKTRFSAIAGSGSLYFGLYATHAMSSIGGYDYTRLIIANTNTSAVALGFSISQTGNATVARTAVNNQLEFWNGSGWSTASANAATGLDVTGSTQYDLALSTDGTTLNIALMNAATFASVINVSFPVSDLGSNIMAGNAVNFSAGDIASNSTDGWTANFYSLAISTPSLVDRVIFFE